MIFCSCRSVNEKHVMQAFNALSLTIDDLEDDQKLFQLYAKAVENALDEGKSVSAKPLDMRCPPCKDGFKNFVVEVVENEGTLVIA